MINYRKKRWMFALSPLLLSTTVFASELPKTNKDWWPDKLDLSPLRQNEANANPQDKNFNYASAFKTLDLNAVVEDLKKLMTTSQDWWPADYGHYGPFFIRMSWHSAGTYRIFDGRGGAEGANQRFAPLNSWPDNTNLDKARRLLWPIKQKYGNKLSWSDLMVLAGNVAMESMGFQTIGFAGGREDLWQPENVNWGYESEWLASQRHSKDGQLKKPFAATQMGLIYVNPEGPNGNSDPIAAAKDIRVTFARMAMNDEETVALIAGGHAFGKAHGAANAKYLGPSPEGAAIEEQGLGWKNSYKTGKAQDTITSGLEGAWSSSPAHWSHDYLTNLFKYNWVKVKSPAGATQWIPDDKSTTQMVPDAHDVNQRHAPMMFTTDLALKFDPAYRKIAERFLKNPKELEMAFAKAWFKLTHRDMGPRSRYLGQMVPKDVFIWQDPVPEVDYALVNQDDIKHLKVEILKSNLTISELIKTAWASASTFRDTDHRGGANGARIMLLPQKEWAINNPEELKRVLNELQKIQKKFNEAHSQQKKISMADLIVLAGSAAIEKAAEDRGYNIEVPFIPGRNDALQSQTDIISFNLLEPKADGFRNYYALNDSRTPEEMLVDKSNMLTLSVPEMAVLVAGLRVLNVNVDGHSYGVFTNQPGTLSNDFFVNLLDMSTKWQKSSQEGIYEGVDVKTGQVKWRGTAVDLIFGSNSELRAVSEFYASSDAQEKFIQDFVRAWVKVMMLDRFELKKPV